MTKTHLEDMLAQLIRQSAALTELMTEQQKQLRAQGEKLDSLAAKPKEKEDDDISPDDEPDETPTAEQRLEEKKQKILNLMGQLPKEAIRNQPRLSEFAEKEDIDNLSGLSESMFVVLLRRLLGAHVAAAYKGKLMKPRLFRAVVSYLDDMGDEDKLPITEELLAEAAEEEKREQAEQEQAREAKLNAGRGRFSLLGRAELERFFNEQVVDIVNNHAAYQNMGIDFPRSFILEGAPGCGKTFAVERLAEHLSWKTYHISSATVGSTYVHGTAKKVEEVFKEAEENAPALVIIDEMDAFMPNRAELSNNDRHHVEEVDSFLKCLQRASEHRVLVVGMTNLISDIDPAVMRTGRMGTHITVGMPSRDEVLAVLADALDKRPHEEELGLPALAEQLLDRPISDITYVAEEAAMTAVRAGHERISRADLQAAFERLQAHTAPKGQRRPLGFNTAA